MTRKALLQMGHEQNARKFTDQINAFSIRRALLLFGGAPLENVRFGATLPPFRIVEFRDIQKNLIERVSIHNYAASLPHKLRQVTT